MARIVTKIFALLSVLGAACAVSSSATFQTVDCRKPSQYRLVVVENASRKKDYDSGTPEDVNIVVGDEVVSRIELPKEGQVKNFEVDAIEKTRTGFEIKVNWGGGVYHYEVQFNFRCQGNNFYLYRVKKISYSTRNPDSGNFLDKQKTKVTRINLPITKFVMTEYL